MVLWIGVDDTDSLRGMCTTFLATEFIRELTKDLDLIGYPRLVRLNPNIPWKTRGNGSVCIAAGRGHGTPIVVGRIRDRDVRVYPRGGTQEEPEWVIDRLSRLVDRWSDLNSEGTDPGLVVLSRKPRQHLYWKAVRGIVSRREAEDAIRGLGLFRTWNSGRGIIGAAAGCAWRPRDRTWEVLAYRDRSRWGTKRQVDPKSVKRMDATFPSTYSNYDFENDRVVIAPRSPCPVLFGIRGDRPAELPRALGMIRGEQPDRWLVFVTNQGTDDHVLNPGISIPRTAGRYAGTVSQAPHTLVGGHVVFGLGAMGVTTYEPARQFRQVVRSLLPGDCVEVIGSVREEPRTLNLEKLRVVRLVPFERKVANPVCPECKVHMKSRGRGAGFRCRRCKRRAEPTEARYQGAPRRITVGWYEPPTGSRRHLSKPLKRGLPS
jgi:tRNA(Ile2)-agmatinylcytidine synthase